MHWDPLGLLFDPHARADWFVSHAALPCVLPRADGTLRVYFSGRDAQNRARIGYFDCRLRPRPEVVRVSPRPVLDLGPLGAFDDAGVTNSCLVVQGGRVHLFYTGWMLGVTVPFYFAVGHALSDDGGDTFVKRSPAPALDRHAVDPFLVASPSIIVEDGRWRCWYVSGDRWEPTPAGPRHYYRIRYAESADGAAWQRRGHVCTAFQDAEEYAHGRPCVLRRADGYYMWFCARGAAYRLAGAVSADGLTWQRRDKLSELARSPGFDDEMQCYPWVFEHESRLYMLYNGNGYGRTGIGLAVARA